MSSPRSATAASSIGNLGNLISIDLLIPTSLTVWCCPRSCTSTAAPGLLADESRRCISLAQPAARLSRFCHRERQLPTHRNRPLPAQIEDALAAVDWMQQHSAELGVDPRRVGACGDSAGGHLALLLGCVRAHRLAQPVRAVAARCAPSDFTSWRPADADSRGSVMFQLFGGPFGNTRDLRAAASPLQQLTELSMDQMPASHLVHDRDETVPLRPVGIIRLEGPAARRPR